jgi:hypothetical protein
MTRETGGYELPRNPSSASKRKAKKLLRVITVVIPGKRY